tara:strand:- start:81 stop:554 length:474 start_codon:yes stop_codon:yes gene_type:complete
MKTINIKGKDYITVNERLKHFRLDKNYSSWRINEELIDINEKEGIFKVTIFDNDGNPIVSAHAQEYRDSSYINKTSFLENGFTSALGRALGYLGIGIDTAISSADEVKNAVNNQKPFLTDQQLKSTLKGTKKQAEAVLQNFQMKDEFKKEIKSKFNI